MAAMSLAQVDPPNGAKLLTELANAPVDVGTHPVWAAEGLARIDGYLNRASEILIRLADSPTSSNWPIWAARALARIDRYEEEGACRLIAFADDISLDPPNRVSAARGLAGVGKYE